MVLQELNSNRNLTVGTTNTLVSEECYQQRSCIVLTNTSTGGQVINIVIGQEAKTGIGIQLAVGGVYQDSKDGTYNPSNAQINAISSAAGGTLSIHERILMKQGGY